MDRPVRVLSRGPLCQATVFSRCHGEASRAAWIRPAANLTSRRGQHAGGVRHRTSYRDSGPVDGQPVWTRRNHFGRPHGGRDAPQVDSSTRSDSPERVAGGYVHPPSVRRRPSRRAVVSSFWRGGWTRPPARAHASGSREATEHRKKWGVQSFPGFQETGKTLHSPLCVGKCNFAPPCSLSRYKVSRSDAFRRSAALFRGSLVLAGSRQGPRPSVRPAPVGRARRIWVQTLLKRGSERHRTPEVEGLRPYRRDPQPHTGNPMTTKPVFCVKSCRMGASPMPPGKSTTL